MIKILKFVFAALLFSSITVFAENQNAASSPKENPSYRGRPITLRDFGADDLGFLSLPDTPPHYGVLILPDSRGLNDEIKKRCDWIAEHGQIALALDFFNGHVPKDDEEASTLQKELRKEAALKEIAAALRLLAESPRLRAGRVIIVAMGRQCPLTLPATKKRNPVIGMTWFQPEGKFDTELFLNSKQPIQIFHSSKSSHFIKWLHKNLKSNRKKITFVEFKPSSLPDDKSSSEWRSAWNQASNFWQRCFSGIYAPKKNFFESLWD